MVVAGGSRGDLEVTESGAGDAENYDVVDVGVRVGFPHRSSCRMGNR